MKWENEKQEKIRELLSKVCSFSLINAVASTCILPIFFQGIIPIYDEFREQAEKGEPLNEATIRPLLMGQAAGAINVCCLLVY
jgi:hypothetical protein